MAFTSWMICPKGFPSPLISIHAPRTGSDGFASMHSYRMSISIHAPRTGSDHVPAAMPPVKGISIHAPRTGSDPVATLKRGDQGEFQSTLPARGATTSAQPSHHRPLYFNPRSPHGERRAERLAGIVRFLFQSTLPARGATRSAFMVVSLVIFQSTLPARGATFQRQTVANHSGDFNPRSPHGERLRRAVL